MTRAEAAAWKYAKASERPLDSAAVLKCAARGDGCVVRPFGTPLTAEQDASASVMQIEGYGGNAWSCDRHKPTKRFAWLHDVAVEDVVAHANAADGAFLVDELRRYLPRKHLDWRAGR